MRQVDIEGFEGYQITDDGRVWSKKSNRWISCKGDKNGYPRVGLAKNGKIYMFKTHRLVAQTFIPNPENKPFIDHIDGDKTNNVWTNLRWATAYENYHNPNTIVNQYCAGRRRPYSEQALKNMSKARKDKKQVFQYTLDGELVAVYESLCDAAKQNDFSKSNISSVCIGKPIYNKTDNRYMTPKTYKGYRWCYKPL